MGGPMCLRLVAAGHRVRAYDLDDDALATVVDAGAAAGTSARDCAEDADFLLTSLPMPPHVEAVMAGPDGALSAMRPGAVWIDLTTNNRELVLQLAAAAPDGLAHLESGVGADLPMTAAARGAFERAAERYGTDAGELCVARGIADDAGVSLELDGDWTPHWER